MVCVTVRERLIETLFVRDDTRDADKRELSVGETDTVALRDDDRDALSDVLIEGNDVGVMLAYTETVTVDVDDTDSDACSEAVTDAQGDTESDGETDRDSEEHEDSERER